MGNKPLPSSIEAEQQVLGSLMIDNKIISEISFLLKEKDFYLRAHQLIYRVIIQLFNESKPVDQVVLTEKLKEMDLLDKIGGTLKLVELVGQVGTTHNVIYYATIVKEKSDRRRMIISLSKLSEMAYDESVQLDKILGDFERIERKEQTTEVISAGNILSKRREIMKERIRASTKILTGFSSIDCKLARGLFPGDLSVIAGRPSMGKTALKINLIKNLCSKGYCVLSFSPGEGLARELDRMDSLLTKISLMDLINVKEWPKEDKRIIQVLKTNKKIDEEWDYHIVPTRLVNLKVIENILRFLRKQVHVVFIDLFDRLDDVNVSQNKPQVVSKKLIEISKLAEDFNTHFCLLVQISRAVVKRKDRRPTLEDLKGSGGYEEIADLIFLLYREGFYNEDILDDEIEIIIAKQKDGYASTKGISLNLNKSILKIQEKD